MLIVMNRDLGVVRGNFKLSSQFGPLMPVLNHNKVFRGSSYQACCLEVQERSESELSRSMLQKAINYDNINHFQPCGRMVNRTEWVKDVDQSRFLGYRKLR